MATTVQVEATNATTTAITLPGSGGRADADMIATFFGNSDLQLEVSNDNIQYTEAPGTSSNLWLQGFPLIIPAGLYVRVRNNSAGTPHTAVFTYRYTGSPS